MGDRKRRIKGSREEGWEKQERRKRRKERERYRNKGGRHVDGKEGGRSEKRG